MKLYDNAINCDPNYYLIYKDKARLYYILNEHEKSKENYELWKKTDEIWENEVVKEQKLREEKSFYKIHPWENHREYFEKESRKKKNYTKVIPADSSIIEKNDQIEKTISRLENFLEEFYENIRQINQEIKKLKEKEKEIQSQIKFEKEQKELHREKGIKKIFSKFSKKNKLSNKSSKKFIVEKNTELTKIKEECCEKEFEKRKFEAEKRKISEEIKEYKKTFDVEKESTYEKDLLVEEVLKIKAELDELKEREKDLPKKNNNESQIGALCKKICQNYKVKKIRGVGRYESGQVHCQTCDVWLDYHGCHKKNGEPAEADSLGMRCNCCNFQVRAKPRGKLSKLRLSKTANSETFEEEIQTKGSLNIEKINKIISKALLLIEKNSVGIYENILQEKLKLSDEDFEKILSRLLRLEDIIEEIEDWGDSTKKVLKIKANKITNNHKKSRKIKKEKSIDQKNIDETATKMVSDYIHWKTNINKKLKIELINAYKKYKSMNKIYELYPNYTKEKIRRHTITDLRLPSKLKELENEGGLHSNLSCSITIALFASDFFEWDGKRNDENKVLELAKSIAAHLQSNNKLNQLFSGNNR